MNEEKIFNIRNNKFYNNFFKELKEFSRETFFEINHVILKDKNSMIKMYNEKEKAGLIIINKAIFQNLAAFFELIEMKLPLPAFNSLRAAIEALRLIRIYYLDNDFREEYLNNPNIEFAEIKDDRFVQSTINKRLEKMEKEIRSQTKIPACLELNNHFFTKGSPVARLHSILSKWSHLVNVNLLFPTHISENKIYLGLDEKYNKNLQQCIVNFLEGAYIINCEQEILISNFSKAYRNKSDNMMKLYEKYINLRYKK